MSNVDINNYTELRVLNNDSLEVFNFVGNKLTEMQIAIQAKVHEIFDYFDKIYDDLPEELKNNITIVREIGSDVFKIVQSVKSFTDPIVEAFSGPATEVASAVRQVSNVINNVYTQIEKLMFLASAIKIGAIVRVPFLLYDLAVHVHKLAMQLFDEMWRKAFFSLANVLNSTGDLALVSTLFVTGLAEFELIAAAVGAAAMHVVGYISLVAAIPFLFIEGNKLSKSEKFQAQLKAKFDAGGFEAVVEFIKDLKDLKLTKKLGIENEALFKAQLQDILESGDKALQIKTMNALDKRIVKKSLSSILKIIAGVIITIAGVIILADPPLAPVGFALYAMSSCIFVGTFITEKKAKNRLIEKMNNLAPKYKGHAKECLEEQWKRNIRAGWVSINSRGLERISQWKPGVGGDPMKNDFMIRVMDSFTRVKNSYYKVKNFLNPWGYSKGPIKTSLAGLDVNGLHSYSPRQCIAEQVKEDNRDWIENKRASWIAANKKSLENIYHWKPKKIADEPSS